MRLRRNSSRRKASAVEAEPPGSPKQHQHQQRRRGSASSSTTTGDMGALPSSCLENIGDMPKVAALEAMSNNDNCNKNVSSSLRSCGTEGSPRSSLRMSPLARLRKHNRLSSRSNNNNNKFHSERSVTSDANASVSIRSVASRSERHSSSLPTTRQHSLRKSVGGLFHALEEFFFPRNPLHAELGDAAEKKKKQVYGSGRTSVRGGVMLDGCQSVAEHYQKVQDVMDAIEHLHGSKGLAAAGLEFRHVLCAEHRPSPSQRVHSTGGLDMLVGEEEEPEETEKDDSSGEGLTPLSSQPGFAPTDTTDVNTSLRSTESLWGEDDDDASVESLDSLFDNEHLMVPQPDRSSHMLDDDSENLEGGAMMMKRRMEGQIRPLHCHLCHRRLFHIRTNTPVTLENRKRFIADGDMYEAIADLCQDYAHEVMCEEAQLEWVTIEDEDAHNEGEATTHSFRRRKGRSISALVNSNHPLIETMHHPQHETGEDNPMAGRPTLLIVTGRGKVRAGIFSRQHLICTSLESSTALPIAREARLRKLNVVIPDPNARGERHGYETFRKTMAKLFSSWEDGSSSSPEQQQQQASVMNETGSEASAAPLQERDLYVLSHSASGAQVARYLMDKSEHYIPHIQAVAFTDSTHNIQWIKNDEPLHNLLESPRCVYFRCSNEQRDSDWYRHVTGEEVKTDEFWQHRFGNIKTYWAGTNEHSLTNWYSHRHIWEHFDSHLSSRSGGLEGPPTIPE